MWGGCLNISAISNRLEIEENDSQACVSINRALEHTFGITINLRKNLNYTISTISVSGTNSKLKTGVF